jgi:hypothetical protein
MQDPPEQVVGAVPDGVVPLIGYREWALSRGDGGPPRLRSLFHPTVWPPDGPLGAVCLRPMIWNGRTGVGHTSVPDALCECGIYAFRDPRFDTLRGAKGPKARGVVRGWGRYVLGTSGWRCEFARIVAVLEDAEDPDAIRAIGDRYGIPVLRSLDDAALELLPAS